MKGKIKQFIKNNIVGIVFGIVFALTISATYAVTTYNSADVMYVLPSGAKITSDNVKGALDQLFDRVSHYKKYYYAYGDPTTSDTPFYTSIVNQGHNIFIRVSEDYINVTNNNKKEVCIVRNGKLGCFKNNNFSRERYYLQAFFSDVTCEITNNYYACSDDNFACSVHTSGYVLCSNLLDNTRCDAFGTTLNDGLARCYSN